MFSRVYSVAVSGLSGQRLDVEADIGSGLPSFTIVGLPDLATQESRERVRSAIKNSGFTFPIAKIVVNLAPASVRKRGAFDLPIALAIIQKEIDLPREALEKTLFLGELALDGSVRPTASVLPSVVFAREAGFERVFVPHDNAREAAMIPDIAIVPVRTLRQAVEVLAGSREPEPAPAADIASLSHAERGRYPDFSSVIGQDHAKRAMLVAAAGGHNILLSGPPGSGKTMLAEAFAGIQPSMRFEEMLEVSKIYSVSGLLSDERPLVTARPFRRVHHTASAASIIGGGRDSRPGEISLAHRGALFLDELLEFDQRILETLRQPLEDGEITVNRVSASYTYPARCQLVAAMNPCPCGYLWDPEISCKDSPREVERYRRKLSGPMLDRIDLVAHVPRVKTEEISESPARRTGETSESLARRVEAARAVQTARFAADGIYTNAEMDNDHIERYCVLDEAAKSFLTRAVEKFSLSTRAYFRLLRVARTVADLDGRESLSMADCAEALSYRSLPE